MKPFKSLSNPKLLILAILFLFGTANSLAQKFAFEANFGHQFGTKLTANANSDNYLKLDAGSNINITAGLQIEDNLLLKLSWYNQASSVLIRDENVSLMESNLSDIDLNWIQIGATYYFSDGSIQPFFGTGAGAAVVKYDNPNLTILDENLDNTAFYGVNMETGVVFWLGKVVGINIKGNVFFPINFEGLETLFPFFNDDGQDSLEATENLKFIAPYLAFNAGLIFRI